MRFGVAWKAPKRARFSNIGSQLEATGRCWIVSAPVRNTPGCSFFFASREDGYDRVSSTHRNWTACLRSRVRNRSRSGLATRWQGSARRKTERWRGVNSRLRESARHGLSRRHFSRAGGARWNFLKGFFLGAHRISGTALAKDRRKPERNSDYFRKCDCIDPARASAHQFLRRGGNRLSCRPAGPAHGLERQACACLEKDARR